MWNFESKLRHKMAKTVLNHVTIRGSKEAFKVYTVDCCVIIRQKMMNNIPKAPPSRTRQKAKNATVDQLVHTTIFSP